MTLEDIKDVVRTLPEDEFSALRFWINEYDNDQWDEQIRRDYVEGRLEPLLVEARESAGKGRSYPLSREGYNQAMDDALADAVDAGFFDQMAKRAIANDDAGRTTPMFPWKPR